MYRLMTMMGIVAIACGVLGCGGSGTETESGGDQSAATITKAQFIHGAERICANLAKEQEAALVSLTKKYPDPKAAQEHFREDYGAIVAPFMRQLADELEGLGKPKGGEVAVAAMTNGLRKASRALETTNPETVKQYRLYTFKRAAFAYGLKTCPAL